MSLQHLPIIYCTMSLERISSATIYIGAPSATIKNNYLNISKNMRKSLSIQNICIDNLKKISGQSSK